MYVKELIKALLECPMDAIVAIEVRSDHYATYSSSDDIDVNSVSDYSVVISEANTQ